MSDFSNKENCWICGDVATTGKHMIQASDVRALFGKPTQKKPLYFHVGQQKNIPVATIRADKLKSEARLCANCNNSKTQSHDRAWQKMSMIMRDRIVTLTHGQSVACNAIFPQHTHKNMLDVHLFFLKKFGCHIAANKIQEIDLFQFSESIMAGSPHPNVYLAFGRTPRGEQKMALNTHLEVAKTPDGICVFAIWAYVVADLTVYIVYAIPGEDREIMKYSWHPRKGKHKHFTAVDFDKMLKTSQ